MRDFSYEDLYQVLDESFLKRLKNLAKEEFFFRKKISKSLSDLEIRHSKNPTNEKYNNEKRNEKYNNEKRALTTIETNLKKFPRFAARRVINIDKSVKYLSPDNKILKDLPFKFLKEKEDVFIEIATQVIKKYCYRLYMLALSFDEEYCLDNNIKPLSLDKLRSTNFNKELDLTLPLSQNDEYNFLFLENSNIWDIGNNPRENVLFLIYKSIEGIYNHFLLLEITRFLKISKKKYLKKLYNEIQFDEISLFVPVPHIKFSNVPPKINTESQKLIENELYYLIDLSRVQCKAKLFQIKKVRNNLISDTINSVHSLNFCLLNSFTSDYSNFEKSDLSVPKTFTNEGLKPFRERVNSYEDVKKILEKKSLLFSSEGLLDFPDSARIILSQSIFKGTYDLVLINLLIGFLPELQKKLRTRIYEKFNSYRIKVEKLYASKNFKTILVAIISSVCTTIATSTISWIIKKLSKFF